MDLFRRATKAVPSPPPPLQLPTPDDKKWSSKKKGLASRLAFFRRPLRLRGNSSISVPLGVVILFPVFVLILILVLFIKHPGSGGNLLMPNGAPQPIRCVRSLSPERCALLTAAAKSAKSTTRCSPQAASSLTQANPAPTPHSWFSRGTRSWMA